MRCKLVLLALVAGLYGCGSDSSGAPACWGAACGGGSGGAAGAAPGDSSVSSQCAPLADVTDMIGSGTVFFGYSVLGSSTIDPGCGSLSTDKEVAVSFKPAFSGDLVISTQHPSTRLDTVLEVRRGECAGTSLGCNGNVVAGAHGSRVTVPVQTGEVYVALVETADDAAGVFALGLHKPGVCDGKGTSTDITADLLQGKRFAADTSASTSSQRGTCATGDQPEVELAFTAPRSGRMSATTVHPDTSLATVLYVREDGADGALYCDSPEAEVGCLAEAGGILGFDAKGGTKYHLLVDGSTASGKATVTLGYAAKSPAPASLRGCDFNAIQDQYAFLVQSGQNVSLKVDTVDAATAADTRLRVRLPDGTELHEADDDVACTFPPPKYECPQYSFAATVSGLYTVEVYVGQSESCASQELVNYELMVTTDGNASELILVKDQ